MGPKGPEGFPQSWGGKVDGNGLPWWVRAISYLGVPAAIAVFLLYYVTVQLSTEIAGLREDVRVQLRQQAVLIYYFQAVCRHTAATQAQRDACEPPR